MAGPRSHRLHLRFAAQPRRGSVTEGGWRYCIKCHSSVWTGRRQCSHGLHLGRSNADIQPSQTQYEQGLVMYGFFYASNPGIRLLGCHLRHPLHQCFRTLSTTRATSEPMVSGRGNRCCALSTYQYLHAPFGSLAGRPPTLILLYSNAMTSKVQRATISRLWRESARRFGTGPTRSNLQPSHTGSVWQIYAPSWESLPHQP